jgi:rRNA maturation endonuclease Nob1
MLGKNSDKRPSVTITKNDGTKETFKFKHVSKGQNMFDVQIAFCHFCGKRLHDRGEICPRCGGQN